MSGTWPETRNHTFCENNFRNPVTYDPVTRSNSKTALMKPKLPQRAKYIPAWFVQAAEEMIRNGLNLRMAAVEVGHELSPEEAERITKSKDFQEIFRNERNKYHAAIGNDPSRTKSVMIGMMWAQAEKLATEGESEKAALVLEKIAKLEGWGGNESNINIFAGLSAKDIAEAKRKLQESTDPEPRTSQEILAN